MFCGSRIVLGHARDWGLLGYNTARRRQEFGVRIVLGASRSNLLFLVLRQSLILLIAGLAIGTVSSVLVGRAITSFLYETSPLDPRVFFLVAFLLSTVVLAASLFPAVKVLNIPPTSALRTE